MLHYTQVSPKILLKKTNGKISSESLESGISFRNEYVPHDCLSLEGEKGLWSAVLERAIADAGGTDDKRIGKRDSTLRIAALDWFKSDDIQPGSFRWCCDQLGFDVGSTRNRILKACQPTVVEEKGRTMENGLSEGATRATVKLPLKAPLAASNGKHARCSAMLHHKGHIDWLRSEARRFQVQLAEAEGTIKRLTPIVTNIEQLITVLGDQPTAIGANGYVHHNGHGRPNGAARRLLPSLPRKPEFEGSLIAALKGCLTAASDPLTDRDLAAAIFAIEPDSAEFRRAVKCVRRTLAHGLLEGRWQRGAANGFTIEQRGNPSVKAV